MLIDGPHIEMHVFTTCFWMGFHLWLRRTPFWEKIINEETDLTTSIYRKIVVRSSMLVMVASLVEKDLWKLQLRQNWNCLEESTPCPGALNGGNSCVASFMIQWQNQPVLTCWRPAILTSCVHILTLFSLCTVGFFGQLGFLSCDDIFLGIFCVPCKVKNLF